MPTMRDAGSTDRGLMATHSQAQAVEDVVRSLLGVNHFGLAIHRHPLQSALMLVGGVTARSRSELWTISWLHFRIKQFLNSRN